MAEKPLKEAQVVKSERIREIMRKMRTLQWQTGETCHQLSEEWGVAVPTVEGMAAEASRRIRDAQFDNECARAILVEQLRLVQRLAIGKTNGKGRELRTIVAAADSIARILGLNSPERHELTTNAELSPDRVRALAAEAFGRVTPEELVTDAPADSE